jgi:hypothetical protein
VLYGRETAGHLPLTDTPDPPIFSATFAEHLQRPVPEFLYHYTSQDGLLGIISSASLWATNISYMNDATEFHRPLRNYGDSLLFTFHSSCASRAASRSTRGFGPDLRGAKGRPSWRLSIAIHSGLPSGIT